MYFLNRLIQAQPLRFLLALTDRSWCSHSQTIVHQFRFFAQERLRTIVSMDLIRYPEKTVGHIFRLEFRIAQSRQ